ncbi:MAG: PspA/IM30 family protein [Bacteroidetes bacterium]|jgi:phage shock protein A|nr:PspA/IM30 family protein [Bacteroidota bacterium]
MSIFKRLFRIGAAETHSLIDKLEDPIKITEQGIREMKADLDKSLQGLAELKALAIRSKKEAEENRWRSNDFEQKAMLLVQKGERAEIAPAEADRLATEALLRKQQCDEQATRAEAEKANFDVQIAKMDQNVKVLRSNITKWENELKTLTARVKVANATTKLNKQLAQMDNSGTIAMLEKMKDKVQQQEALAESYADIANEAKTVDEEIDKVLADSEKVSANDALASLKARMHAKQGGEQ